LYGCHFVIIIELKKFAISSSESEKQTYQCRIIATLPYGSYNLCWGSVPIAQNFRQLCEKAKLS